MRDGLLFSCVLLGLSNAACAPSDAATDGDDDSTVLTGAGGGSSASTAGPAPYETSGAGGGSSSAGSGQDGGAGGGAPESCPPVPACDAPPPDPGPALGWNHTTSSITAALGSPNHRGRDLLLNPGDPQWVIAKFAYGLNDKDLKDEQVDIWLDRGCTGAWELLGSVLTTEENEHGPVEGVEDSGGRVFFPIPAERVLAPGRHRVHLVVRGDLSATDLFIEVVPPETPVFVSDVDGTLTTYETEEFTALLTGALPAVNADAPAVFHELVARGYRPMYLTARPEWLVARTREFLDHHGFPPGVVHTTTGLTGATGGSAVSYKTGELDVLSARGLTPAFAFGNTDSDAEAYDHAAIEPLDHRLFFQFDDAFGGRRFDAYGELIADVQALPPACGSN